MSGIDQYILGKIEFTPTSVAHYLDRVHNDALEAAARACEVEVPREADYDGRFGGYGPFEGPMTASECAAAIRAMKR